MRVFGEVPKALWALEWEGRQPQAAANCVGILPCCWQRLHLDCRLGVFLPLLISPGFSQASYPVS